MMITLRLKIDDTEKLSSDDISNFEFIYNEQSNCIDVYKDSQYSGELIGICGMTDDEFIKALKERY